MVKPFLFVWFLILSVVSASKGAGKNGKGLSGAGVSGDNGISHKVGKR
jgi:hypothetical protein